MPLFSKSTGPSSSSKIITSVKKGITFRTTRVAATTTTTSNSAIKSPPLTSTKLPPKSPMGFFKKVFKGDGPKPDVAISPVKKSNSKRDKHGKQKECHKSSSNKKQHSHHRKLKPSPDSSDNDHDDALDIDQIQNDIVYADTMSWIVSGQCPADLVPKILTFAGPRHASALAQTHEYWHNVMNQETTWKIFCEDLYKVRNVIIRISVSVSVSVRVKQ
jgi:hypothetical protein